MPAPSPSSLNAEAAEIARQIKRRRTFAIISHPDAGKTTLTEKLLLYSGLIHTAGMVKNRKGRKATSDWMGMEQERGISITSSAMQFPYKDCIINVLDTPGHQDFSEDTYRTLTAADSAIMVLDAGRGVQAQTRKLFEVCKLRKIPVLTFINKLDQLGRDPLELLAEVEEVLGIHAAALNWPIGSGEHFQGVLDRRTSEVLLFHKTGAGGSRKAEMARLKLDDPELTRQLGEEAVETLRHDLELLQVAGNPFDRDEFLAGEVTPVFFGSALTNFGVEPFYDAFVELAPPPGSRSVDMADGSERLQDPAREPFSAYIFKLQANMDKRHRDCLAFVRVCSGRFERDLVVKHERTGKEVRLSRPHSVVARERATVDEAFPGDVVGLINRADFRIGDTISVSGGFQHKPLPFFQPEIFARLAPKDLGNRKRFDKGMEQLAAEGTVQLVYPEQGVRSDPLLGAVGKLQFDVLQYRLRDEYGVDTQLSPMPYECSAWLVGDRETFKAPTTSMVARDMRGQTVILFTSEWDKRACAKNNPDHELLDYA